MAATKKSAAGQHKKSPPTGSVGSISNSGAQVFDIIPRNQVKPSASSRPIITTTQPEQADNTLKTAPLTGTSGEAQAAAAQLKHKPLNLKLSAPGNDEDPEDEKGGAASKGVPLSDLIASKSSAAAATPAALDSDSPAAAEAAEPKADADAETKPKPEAEEPAEAAKAPSEKPEASEAAPETAPEPQVPEKAEQPVAADAAPKTEPEADSVDQVLKDDAADETQPHSQALKNELATLDKDHPADGEGADGEHPHHELYGGKPVIVIHKGHSGNSALNAFLWLLVCLLLAVIIVDVLLDMNIITTTFNIPHTNWF
jgi:hypothetical protein